MIWKAPPGPERQLTGIYLLGINSNDLKDAGVLRTSREKGRHERKDVSRAPSPLTQRLGSALTLAEHQTLALFRAGQSRAPIEVGYEY